MPLLPRALGALTLAAALPAAALAQSTVPAPAPTRIDVTKIQPKSLLFKTKLHTEFVVETNNRGQVTRVRDGKNSPNHDFNFQTYGNALQAFIRTPDGHAVPGVYRLTYDYDPKTTRVHRDVQLVKRGGVNPNATGAVTQMMALEAKAAAKDAVARARAAKNVPVPKVNGSPVPSNRLPDLNGVMRATAPPK